MPKITRDVVLLSIGFGLLIAMILFTVFGCRCRIERFEGEGADADATTAPPAVLTKKEAELFEGLQAGKFTEEQIKTFMKNGVLNEQVIDKFLSKMTSAAAATPEKEADKKPAAAEAATAKGAAKAAEAKPAHPVVPEPHADPKIETFSTITTLARAQNTIQKLRGSR